MYSASGSFGLQYRLCVAADWWASKFMQAFLLPDASAFSTLADINAINKAVPSFSSLHCECLSDKLNREKNKTIICVIVKALT